MRLPLPPEFPDVDLPLELVASTVISRVQTGLPGRDLLVILPNNFGLIMTHGRESAWCNADTVEAVIVRVRDRDMGLWLPAHDTKIRTTDGGTIQGWATGEWLAASLLHLASL